MYLFLFILLPAALFIYFNTWGEKKFITLAFTGLITGIIVCGIRFIFFFSHRLIPDSFFLNYFFYLVKIALAPVLVYVVFILISRDSVDFKIKAFFPLIASFNAIYLPYYFLTMSGSVYSNYDLFFRPIIYLAFLAGIAYALWNTYVAVKNNDKKKKILYIVMAVVYVLIPPAIDSSYIVNRLFPFFAIIGLIYIAFPIGLAVYEKVFLIKKSK